MTKAELEEEEKNVKLLATYISEKAVPNLINELKQQEGVPFDSKTLTEFFHKRGINMRYLGKVYAAMDSVPEASEKMNVH